MPARRRNVGAAASLSKNRQNTYFEAKGHQLKEETLSSAVETISKLENELIAFAKKNAESIQRDAAFRAEFLKMCGPLGIDPLSSQKGLFENIFGIGQFYFELAVKVAEVCISTRPKNGGIISVAEVREILLKRGTRYNFSSISQSPEYKFNCSEDDIITSVGKLSILGSGFRTETIRGTSPLIISVPIELNKDHMEVIQVASQSDLSYGRITLSDIISSTRWDVPRAKRAIELLLKEGMVWLDKQSICDHEDVFWFPSLWNEALSVKSME